MPPPTAPAPPQGPVPAIALQSKKLVCSILFRAAAATLRRIAADPKHLGANIGFLAVLHTWVQNLQHHPHHHRVVPGGGLSPDGRRRIACRNRFFLPARVLSRLFRGLFLCALEDACAAGKLAVHGSLQPPNDPHFHASANHLGIACATAESYNQDDKFQEA